MKIAVLLIIVIVVVLVAVLVVVSRRNRAVELTPAELIDLDS